MKIKQKTKKAVAKRFRKSAGGKIKFSSTGRGHLLSCKSRKRKRHLRKGGILSGANALRIAAVLPH
jgi:large subunit ribosomal protein L35